MGMGVGLGFGMGNMMGQQMAGAAQTMGQQGFPAGNAPTGGGAAAPAKSLKDELTDLKELFDGQLINQAEYDAPRAIIMKKHGMGN
jgi:membrane protease subunit (stomatin/prohibitin family)